LSRYSGRRGLATKLANQNPQAAQGMLRHASLNTTQEFYIKAIPAATLDAMKQLEAEATKLLGVGAGTVRERFRQNPHKHRR
jgi:hypothetical protein